MSETITGSSWADAQTCGCWPSRGQVCWAHAGHFAPTAPRGPYRCPVCEGKGRVPNGFYDAIGVESWMSSSCVPEACRSCNGAGVLWG